ncbi:MAG: hypothetical protein CM15mP13_0750 [Pseudomonadota bacterium]|nr:MAG: hypothetical protein CM15mP13_0750 [Pseudomonadota bacterium]
MDPNMRYQKFLKKQKRLTHKKKHAVKKGAAVLVIFFLSLCKKRCDKRKKEKNYKSYNHFVITVVKKNL